MGIFNYIQIVSFHVKQDDAEHTTFVIFTILTPTRASSLFMEDVMVIITISVNNSNAWEDVLLNMIKREPKLDKYHAFNIMNAFLDL